MIKLKHDKICNSEGNKVSTFLWMVVFTVSITSLALLAVLKGYDIYVGRTFVPSDRYPTQMEFVIFDSYPYSAGHMAANITRKRIRSGSMGYWYTDLDLVNPLKKKQNEYRIILIGGSGAQGQGSPDYANEEMLYSQLEGRLNELLSSSGRIVRVINMAMGGSVTHYNARDLNLFAHPLEPDLILSYSGFNDWAVPLWFSGFMNQQYCFPSDEKGFRPQPPPFHVDLPFGRFASILFPHLIALQGHGSFTLRIPAVRSNPIRESRNFYNANQRLPLKSKKETFQEYVVPYYVNALRTIKRDFMGIPIMVAWQCVENNPDEFVSLVGNPKPVLGYDFYNRMFERVRNELQHYINDKWYFVNTHALFEDDPRLFGLHLTTEAQAIVAANLAGQLATIINQR